MSSNIFAIDNYNLLQDEENYYFLRALNNGDLSDIASGITISNGKIMKIRTDLDRYNGDAIFSQDDEMSLEEVFEHIRINHRTDTKCISLTSNANVAALYGREYYKDQYVLIQVPKKNFGTYVVNAGQYMIQEINKRIESFIQENPDSNEAQVIKQIMACDTEEAFETLKKNLLLSSIDEETNEDSLGLVLDSMTSSVDYQALNDIQNLEKNKVIAMIDVLNFSLLKKGNNKSLIRTLGMAFASLEQIHYGQVDGNKISSFPYEIIDLIASIQQLDNSEEIEEIKRVIINYIKAGNYTGIEPFKYQDYDLSNYHNIDYFYNVTDGMIPYNEARDLYFNSFYLIKSRLRARHCANTLRRITSNNSMYESICKQIEANTYGVEPSVFAKDNTNKLKISENVHFDLCEYERELFLFINRLDSNSLEDLINNPEKIYKQIGQNINYIQRDYIDKITYFAEAIIESFPWKKVGVKYFYGKNLLVDKLIEINCYELYKSLQSEGIPDEKICQMLLTMVLRGVKKEDLIENDCFTIAELERFLGYYKIDKTNIELRDYQMAADARIDEKFKTHQFTSLILPTGSGKSFVVLAQLLKRKDESMLYLAPNDVILQQFKEYILTYVTGWEGVSEKGIDGVIKNYFPNLKLATYNSLLSFNQKEIIDSQYDFIVFDELHRTGAPEWQSRILQLLNNQKYNCKVLGVTATPLRDVDLVDMSDYWARWFGYSDREIASHQHVSLRMDLFDAIKLGYVNNIKIVSCDYALQNGDALDSLEQQIELINDNDKYNNFKVKFNQLRKTIASSGNVDQILSSYVDSGDKCIVFCPALTRTLADISGEYEDYICGEEAISFYSDKLIDIFGKDNVTMLSMLGSRGKKANRDSVYQFNNLVTDKIVFQVVINILNEGYHPKNIKKIIWFRALDKNSFILYFQQIGRLVHAVDPNKPLSDDDLGVAIDLPNNTLEIVYNRSKSVKTDDLDMLNLITLWSLKNKKIPDVNSVDRIEVQYATLLKRIQKRYLKYVNEPKKLDKLDTKSKFYIEEIIRLGNTILLWTTKLSTRTREYIDRCDRKIEPFKLNGVARDFCDLRSEVTNEIGYLSFEEKLQEICNHSNFEFVINKKSIENFSDNSGKIGKWIHDNKDQILREVDVNFNAHKIALAKRWITLTFDDCLDEIYLISQGKKENVPISSSRLKFSDGKILMGNWIKRNKPLIIARSNTSTKARLIAQARGWLNLSFDECLEEIYNLANGKEELIPSSDSKIRFSDDSAVIGTWIYSFKDKITSLSSSNRYAYFIAHAKGWSTLEFDDYLDEIYDTFKDGINEFRKDGKRLRFSDNHFYIDLWVNDNKTTICEHYFKHLGAKLICDYKNWNPLKFEECLKEAHYCLADGSGKTDIACFSGTNFNILSWINSNKSRIMEEVEFNSDALFIAVKMKWIVLSFSDRVKEISMFLDEHPTVKLTNADKFRFSDDSAYMSSWIYSNKVDIIKESKFNEYAKRIVLLKGWQDIHTYLMEIYTYCNGDCKLVKKIGNKRTFSDGKQINNWITRNKSEIIKLANENDVYAIFVAKSKGWLNLKFEERLHEAALYYLENNGMLPETIRFSDDSASMASWLSDNVVEIKKLMSDNVDAKIIGRNRGWLNLGFDECLREIFEYAGGNISMVPVRGSLSAFSDGRNMYNWIRHNCDEIKKVMFINPYAYFVACSKKWINADNRNEQMEAILLELQFELQNLLNVSEKENNRTRK